MRRRTSARLSKHRASEDSDCVTRGVIRDASSPTQDRVTSATTSVRATRTTKGERGDGRRNATQRCSHPLRLPQLVCRTCPVQLGGPADAGRAPAGGLLRRTVWYSTSLSRSWRRPLSQAGDIRRSQCRVRRNLRRPSRTNWRIPGRGRGCWTRDPVHRDTRQRGAARPVAQRLVVPYERTVFQTRVRLSLTGELKPPCQNRPGVGCIQESATQSARRTAGAHSAHT